MPEAFKNRKPANAVSPSSHSPSSSRYTGGSPKYRSNASRFPAPHVDAAGPTMTPADIAVTFSASDIRTSPFSAPNMAVDVQLPRHPKSWSNDRSGVPSPSASRRYNLNHT